MNFKESLAQDLDVFIGLEEFAQVIEIDEIKLPAILIEQTGELSKTNVTSRYGKNFIRTELHNQPLIGNTATVYFKTAEYVAERGRIPKHTEFTRINGKRYRVESATDSAGITRLELTTDTMNTPPPGVRLPSLYDN